METSNTCPKFAKCPIYLKSVFKNETSGESYKNLYCNAGESRFKACKRYQVSEKAGMPAPENIMPNSSLTVDDIISKMNVKC